MLIIDTSGLVDPASVVPVPGGANGNVAQTQVIPEANCSCKCDNNSTIWKINCTVTTTATITLPSSKTPIGVGENGTKFQPAQQKNIGWSQIFGHEQRHVVSRNALVTAKAEEWRNKSNSSWNNKRDCDNSTSAQRDAFYKEVRDAAQSGSNHSDQGGQGGAQVNSDSPLNRVGYAVLPNSPALPAGF